MRITKELRQAIIDNAVVHSGLPKRIKVLQERTAECAEQIRLVQLGGADSAAQMEKTQDQIVSLYQSLPDGVRGYGVPSLNSRLDISIRPLADDPNAYITLRFCGTHVGLRRTDIGDDDYRKWLVRGVPSKSKTAPSCGRKFAGKFPKPLCNRARKIESDWKDIRAELEELTIEVSAVLASVTSTKKLLEVWPEAEKLLPPVEQKAHLPAVPTARLNSMLKL